MTEHDDLRRFVDQLLADLDLPPELRAEAREDFLAHLEEDVRARRARGVAAPDAVREAISRLGTRGELRHRLREAASRRRRATPRPGRLFANLLGDLRHASRALVRAPLFAVTIVSTVAIGIGGTAAAFGLVNAVLLEPLPYPDPGQLHYVYTARADGSRWGLSMADYVALVEQQTSFSQVAMYDDATLTLQGDDFAHRVPVQAVTASYFELLGVRPAIGRVFLPKDSEPEAERVVVVSHGFWVRYLESDRDLSDTSIRIGGLEMPVIGVLPPRTGPLQQGVDVFYNMHVETPPRKGPFGRVALVRLPPGTSDAAAAAELRAINERIFPLWEDSWPDQTSTWAMLPLEELVIGDAGSALVPVLAAIGLLLLIASTNSANLLLARGVQRRRELAVRSALGASRARLIGTLTTEGALLAVVSSAAGLGLCRLLFGAARLYADPYVPRLEEVGLTGPVLTFWLAISVGSAALFLLLPAAQLTGSDLLAEVRQAGGRTTSAGGLRHIRRALVVAQLAVAMPLLVGAGLLMSSLWSLGRVDPGFEPDDLLTARVNLMSPDFSDGDVLRGAWNDMLEQVRALPGVLTAGIATGLPPDNPAFGNNFVLEDVPLRPGESQLSVPWVTASAGYFETLRIPLVEGRLFEPQDADDGVAVVDRAWAERFFPGASSVGRRFRHGSCTREGCPWWTVIGVVGHVAYEGLGGTPAGIIYANSALWSPQNAYVVVRTAVTPLGLLEPLRDIVRETDPGAPVTSIATGDELLRDSLREPRYLSLLMAVFASVALAISVVGIYGVMAYFVQHHRRDIGIRLALGGDSGSVSRLVVGNGMRLVAVGVGIGLAGALVTTRFMGSLLYRVQPTEPAVFAGVALGAAAVTLVACALPARRAATLDPTDTLRDE